MTFLLIALSLLAYAAASPLQQRHMLLSLVVQTQEQVDLLNSAAATDYEIDFWTHPRLNSFTDVMVPASRFESLRQQWQDAGMTVVVKQHDVEDLVERVEETNRQFKAKALPCNSTTVGHFYRSYDEIVEAIKYLDRQYGPRLVRFDEWATYPRRERTIEGRHIHYVELGKMKDDWLKDEKPVIMMDVAIHAREWITAAANLYMIDWLLTNYETDPRANYLLNEYTIVIIPVANPDGYEYSRICPNTRLWRKNRRPKSRMCVGVDLNRNFPYKWQNEAPCYSEIYAGDGPKSEPESRALISIFRYYEARIVMFFSVHSYSQILVLPWVYSNSTEPVNEWHQKMGDTMAAAMEHEGGLHYLAATAKKAIGYTARGSSIDWALNEKQTGSYPNSNFIALAYELRPKAGSSNGFILPASHIEPTGKELMASVVEAAAYYDEVVNGNA